ncbi:MAG: aldehyde dehydrogenase family protein [Pseudomonadota bacterium]|uniref:aldehyde dehydrogenase family protein n=1 Tax=Phenylobacterium sp. TaxID=1871053 RepID=UPI002600AD98|nr:aldehyde dehydrogenase family protein [Phenylobacterium sp.]MBT9470550.1 aldehyde dehydrogenase family protein [Phenylobacterium sp.]
MPEPIRAVNCRTGEVDFTFPPATSAAVAAEAHRLRAGQAAWAALGLDGRATALLHWADAITAARLEIISALAADTGRWYLSEREVDGAANNLRRWAKLAPEVLTPEMTTESRQSALIGTVSYQNQYVPFALAGFISPWNFPVTLSLIDAAPALAAGCAVLIKPSEVTSRFVAPFLKTLDAVPALKAVVGLVTGGGQTGQAVVDQVDLICFTGSVSTGRGVAEAAARKFIPAFLELGGKDPLIVLEGADLEQATDAALRGSVLNTGQVCLSIERIYVHRSLYPAFVERLVEKAKNVSLNHPDIHAGHIGPLIFHKQAETIEAHLKDAIAKGATIACGGEVQTHGGGRWCPATVVIDVTHDMALMTDETFGPIMPVMAFDTVDEAVALANDTTFGLSAAVIGPSADAAKVVAMRINAGGLSINDCGLTYMTYEPEKTSFGYSGLGGSRMGPASIQRFLRKKALIVQNGAPQSINSFGEHAATTPAAA